MIPTYTECKEIIENNPHGCFYERVHIVDNYNISIFSYKQAKYNNFILPIIDKPHINALELKGLSFVFNSDNTIYNRNIMLHKFWEIDQYHHSKYELYKNKKIKNVTVKEDGYLVRFIRLPNGKITSQMKTGFHFDTNRIADSYLKDRIYYDFISDCLDKNITPLFELIYMDRIVEYDKNNLLLLKSRDYEGNYIDLDFKYKVKEVNHTLDEILDICETLKNSEGFVVHFEDDTMLKIKTKWWRLNNHQ